ncbi:MAG: PAS domain S-box protein [Nitrospirae bacterium]|nr:PAS domain S-box protein [Nitrospirota bacterium]
MQVKQRLKINIAVSVTAALIILLMLSLGLYRVNRALEASDIADEIGRGAFERSTFREDYLRTNSERARDQWFVKYEHIGKLLTGASEKFQGAEDRKIIEELIKDHQATKKLFTAIVEERNKSGLTADSAALSEALEDRLRTQLHMRLYDKLLNIRNLHESARENLSSSLMFAGVGIFAAFVIILAATSINSWTMGRMIADRILRLRDGASVIGGGNLDYRIDIKGDDEFAELSDSFNAMTVKLSGTNSYLKNEIEERKRAEEAVRASEANVRNFLNTAAIGLVRVSRDLHYLSVNAAYGTLVGRPVDQIVGRTIGEVLGEPALENIRPYIERALRGERIECEMELRIEATRARWIHVIYSPDHDDAGAVIGFVGSIADVTERKQAEEARRESDRRVREILASITSGYQVIDRHGRYTEFNDPAQKMIAAGGRDPDALLGQHVLEAFPDTRDLAGTHALLRTLTERVPTEAENFYEAWHRWFAVRNYPTPDGGVAMFFDDITERKLAEDEIKRRNAVQNGINRIFKEALTCDTEEQLGRACLAVAEEITQSRFGFIDELNPATGRLDVLAISDPGWDLCRVEDKMGGHGKAPISVNIHGIYGRVFLDGKPLLTNDPASHEDSIGIPEGHPPLTAFLGVPLIHDGKTIGIVGLGNREGGYRQEDLEVLEALTPVIIEVLLRARAEEALRKAYDDLEIRVRERTKELREINETLELRVAERTAEIQSANISLRNTSKAALNMMEDAFDARRQAEEANAKLQIEVAGRMEAEEQIRTLNEQLQRKIDELITSNKELESFSYSVSHDLRAPLRHLTGFAELLKKRVGSELDEKSREYVEFISGAAVQMGKLIDDLLSFSRAGRVEMKLQQMHLDIMVRGVIRSLGSEAEGRDVEWNTQVLPEVLGDPSLLKLVWTNLISNALKFTRTKKHAIIEIGSRDEGSEYVFFVKDNGVGFDMRFKDKLFSIFQRLHSPTEFEGTGVGLANVQRIVSRHGGRVWAESEVGDGATFYFTLPK